MSSGSQRREPTERETIEAQLCLARGKLAYHRAEMERAEAWTKVAEDELKAFAARERAEMAKASGIEPPRRINRPNPPSGIWGMDCRARQKPDEFGMGCGICKSCADRFSELIHIATADELEHDLGRVIAIWVTPRFREAALKQ